MYFDALPKLRAGPSAWDGTFVRKAGRSWITEEKPAPLKIVKGILLDKSYIPCGDMFKNWQVYANTLKIHYNSMTWYLAEVTPC